MVKNRFYSFIKKVYNMDDFSIKKEFIGKVYTIDQSSQEEEIPY